MPRRPASLDSVVAALRQHFNLGQPELAQWLGVSTATVGHLETGRCALSPAAAEALAPLVALLPPPGGPAAGALRLASAATPPALAMAPPEAAPLAARLDYCQHHARRLRRTLAPLEAQAATAARWAAALPALRAALPPDPGPTAAPAADWPAW